MTKEEFETFLIDIGGLKRTYKEHRGPIVEAGFFQMKEGWYQLVSELITELLKLGWDKRVHQAKEKFGGLRFYVENPPVGGHDIITKYEKLSYSICEVCGEKGVLREGSWIRTLCDTHSEGKGPLEDRMKKFLV